MSKEQVILGFIVLVCAMGLVSGIFLANYLHDKKHGGF